MPAALAQDGKFICDTVGIVCLAEHETGVPRAMIKASQKEGEGQDCSLHSHRFLEPVAADSSKVYSMLKARS